LTSESHTESGKIHGVPGTTDAPGGCGDDSQPWYLTTHPSWGAQLAPPAWGHESANESGIPQRGQGWPCISPNPTRSCDLTSPVGHDGSAEATGFPGKARDTASRGTSPTRTKKQYSGVQPTRFQGFCAPHSTKMNSFALKSTWARSAHA